MGEKRRYTQQEVHQRMKGRTYYNPDDANIFVKRKEGIGSWTMNLGNKWTWVILGCEILAIIAIMYILPKA